MATTKPLNFQPIILIGAARSGTKMLRDIIAQHPSVAKVPFDVNFVWKYGNERIPHDELRPADLNKKGLAFVHKYCQNFAGNQPYLIEKTVSNALRVPFIQKVFPHAKLIYLVRDGRDVVESVNRQWGTSPDKKYLLRKVKTYPIAQALNYALSYGTDLVKIKLLGQPSDAYVWGVKYEGYEKDLAELDTLSFCAKQWLHCVNHCETVFSQQAPESYLKIRYEDFVTQPGDYLKKIAAYLNLATPFDPSTTRQIKSGNIGKGFKNLSEEQRRKIMEIIRPAQERLNYDSTPIIQNKK